MPTIIDSLLVTLGLDASAYRKSAAQVTTAQGKVVEESDKMAKRVESDGKRAAESFRNVRNEVAGLLLAFTGAASIGAFARSIVVNDAAVGRLATNLGVATGELSKWQELVKQTGGNSGDADSTFRSLKGIFNDVRLTGNMSAYGDLAGLGITDINQLKDPADALLKIAGTGERMDRSEFTARLGRLGISESMITLLGKGRVEVARMLAEQEKLGHATDQTSEAAQKFERTLARVESLLREKVRPILTDVLEWFETWAGDTNNLNIATTALLVVLGGLSLWVIAAAAPWIAFAAAIALVLGNLDRLKGIAAALLAGDFKGAWNVLTSGSTFGAPDVSRASPDWIANVNKGLPSAGGAGRGANAGIIAYLRRAGFSNEQARGIDAGIGAEGGHAGARNPTSGAYGIGQWLGARKRGLFAKYGPNPSHDQQMAYLVWELNGGDHGGKAVRGQQSAEGTLNAYIRNFMRPAAGRETMGDLSRGMGILGGRPPVGAGARGGGGSSTTTMSVGEVKIYTAATDARGIARDIPKAMADRGLVVQSASGMNP